MGFRGQEYSFDSPAAAVAGMIACLGGSPPALRPELTNLDADVPTGPLGRILAEDVQADRDSPAFDHSAMDGFAVRFGTIAAARDGALVLTVAGESRIGHEPPVMPEGRVAIRIATGAAVPPGADTVIRREDVVEATGSDARKDTPGPITISAHAAGRVKPGDHIRRRGENARAGAVVLRAGEVVSAAGLGTLAAVGVTGPRVFPRLRVAIITTGDEVVPPRAVPAAFQIRNSNAPALRAILASPAWMVVASVAHAHDEGELDGVLRAAVAAADAVVLTGGVSMGHRDPVREAVEAVGAEVIFHGLPQRPGKPMLGAVLRRAGAEADGPLPIFGLPGNPVSALVTCTRIVLPVLAACAGASRTPPDLLPGLVRLAHQDGRSLDLWWHRPVRLSIDEAGTPTAEIVDTRGSGDMIAAGLSDGFVELPPSESPAIAPFYAWPAS